MNYSEKSKCSRNLFRFKTLNVSQWVTLCYIFFLEKKEGSGTVQVDIKNIKEDKKMKMMMTMTTATISGGPTNDATWWRSGPPPRHRGTNYEGVGTLKKSEQKHNIHYRAIYKINQHKQLTSVKAGPEEPPRKRAEEVGPEGDQKGPDLLGHPTLLVPSRPRRGGRDGGPRPRTVDPTSDDPITENKREI